MTKGVQIYDSFEQRSDDWYSVRMGVATASQFKRICGGRGGDITYMAELIAQRLTKKAKHMYMGESMEHGMQTEDQAVSTYEFMNNVEVKSVGFIKIDEFIGCSPDGLVGDDGIIEIKCPDSHTHVKWRITGGIPKEHFHQLIGSLWVTGRDWADFISFDPRIESPHDIFIQRVYAENMKKDIEEISSKVMRFRNDMIGHLKTFDIVI